MCSKSSGNRTFDLEVRMSKDIRDWRRKDLLVITETLYRLCCRGFAIVLQGTESKARAMSLERSPARESWECLRCYTQDRFPILQRPMLRLASLEAGESVIRFGGQGPMGSKGFCIRVSKAINEVQMNWKARCCPVPALSALVMTPKFCCVNQHPRNNCNRFTSLISVLTVISS
jgi:RNase P subunit RPR2